MLLSSSALLAASLEFSCNAQGRRQEFPFSPASVLQQRKVLKNMNLANIKCFVLDMDGTIYLGDQLFDFTQEFLHKVEQTGRRYYFFTNNSSKSQAAYIEKLAKLGINIQPNQMMISSHVMISYLREHHPDKSIYVMGTNSLVSEFRKFNINLVEEGQTPDIVVIGFDTQLDYQKLCNACTYVRHGAIYYGINPDWNCPMEGGEFIPDCGSMAKLIEASTGRFPEFFGKPSRHTLDYIVKTTGAAPSEIAIVGDRLYTDIAVAANSDVTSILVLSGESKLEDVESSTVKPTMVVSSLKSITNILH